MKAGIVLATLALTCLGDCDWGGQPGNGGGDGGPVCPVEVRTNLAGQNIDTGTVSITNDEHDLIVVIEGTGGWKISEWHIYAGTGGVPLNGGGNPVIGRFPYGGSLRSAQEQVIVTIPLDEIGGSCGAELEIAVHSVMKKKQGLWTYSETAWARWDEQFPGARWGGSFGYTVCCGGDEDEACVEKVSKFAQQPEAWPAGVDSLALGGVTYSRAELTEILNLDMWALGGDVSVFVAQQAIAARLNAAAGVTLSADQQAALDEVDGWLARNADGDGRLPFGVAHGSLEGLIGYGLVDPLFELNEGSAGVPRCDGTVPEDLPPLTGCVLPPWYWGQNPMDWPAGISSVDLGSTTYSKSEILTVLYQNWLDHGGDVSVFLAHETIAARINAAVVGGLPAPVTAALAQADAWFDAHADADGRVPYGISRESAEGAEIWDAIVTLVEFNQGNGGVPLCY